MKKFIDAIASCQVSTQVFTLGVNLNNTQKHYVIRLVILRISELEMFPCSFAIDCFIVK